MKKILLLTILFSCYSCAYKPTLLRNMNKTIEGNMCFQLGKETSNRQKIYYKIKREFAKYPDEKELRYYYDLDEYISYNENRCINSKWILNSIETEKLFFSDTGKVKNGILLTVDITIKKNNKQYHQQKFQIRKIGEFNSGFTATKKKTARDILELLDSAFQKLTNQVADVASNL